MAKRKNSKFLKVQINYYSKSKSLILENWYDQDWIIFQALNLLGGHQNRLGDLEIAMTIQNMKKYFFGNKCCIFHKC